MSQNRLGVLALGLLTAAVIAGCAKDDVPARPGDGGGAGGSASEDGGEAGTSSDDEQGGSTGDEQQAGGGTSGSTGDEQQAGGGTRGSADDEQQAGGGTGANGGEGGANEATMTGGSAGETASTGGDTAASGDGGSGGQAGEDEQTQTGGGSGATGGAETGTGGTAGSAAGAGGASAASAGAGGIGADLSGGGDEEPLTLPDCTVYVSTNGDDANDGTSWDSAKVTMQAGIDAAWQDGCMVWVAAGTYTPTASTVQTVTIQLRENIPVFGGFAGTETDFEQRDWVANETILSGDIGVEGDIADNSYHVVTTADGAALDGFTITGGNADTTVPGGGGVYNTADSFVMRRCKLAGNVAQVGGGLYSTGTGLIVSGCSFLENAGEGMRVSGSRVAEVDAYVTDSLFSENSGNEGGGLASEYSRLTVTNCVFSNNTARVGGGLYRLSGELTVINCTFSGNSATSGGGGVYSSSGGTSTIRNSEFLQNVADGSGGALVVTSVGAVVSRCIVSGNSAETSGGGIVAQSDATIDDVEFSQNSAGTYGGALSTGRGSVTNCTFLDNTAQQYAGAVYNYGQATLTNCVFAGNVADPEGGGAIYNDASASASLINCTLTDNSSAVGGGIFNAAGTVELSLVNSILWGDAGGEVSGGTVTATYTINQGNLLPGDGNSGDDPLFFDAAGGDFRLSGGSPALDAGDPTAAPDFDIDGNPRDDTPDLGAYEGAAE